MYKQLYTGDYVQIGEKFFKIGRSEPLQYDTGTEATAIFSAVATGSTSGYKNVTELEPDDFPKHLFWVVPGIEDGMKYFFKLPTGTARFGTDVTKSIGFLTNLISPHYAPNPEFGFYLIEDYYPSIEASNVTLVANTPKVYFTGEKYDLEEIKDSTIQQKLKTGGTPVKYITLGGINTQ